MLYQVLELPKADGDLKPLYLSTEPGAWKDRQTLFLSPLSAASSLTHTQPPTTATSEIQTLRNVPRVTADMNTRQVCIVGR